MNNSTVQVSLNNQEVGEKMRKNIRSGEVILTHYDLYDVVVYQLILSLALKYSLILKLITISGC